MRFKAKMENELASIIVKKSFYIHQTLGPGLLESVYESILFDELIASGLHVKRQVLLPVVWKERVIEQAYRIDLLVEDLLICEIKATEVVHPVHACQLLTYLKLSNKKLGLLINFHSPLLKHGIKRIVNGL